MSRSLQPEDEGVEEMESDVLDVDQNPEERRRLRASYRQLIEEAHVRRDDPYSCSVKDLDSTLQDAKALYGSVKMPREAAYDAELLSIVSAIGKQKISMVQANVCEFDLMSFATKLSRYMRTSVVANDSSNDTAAELESVNSSSQSKFPTESQWVALGRQAAGCMRFAPCFKYMYGSFNYEAAEFAARPERRAGPRQSQTTAAVVKVQQVRTGEAGDGDERTELTTDRVEAVRLILKRKTAERGGPIGYFDFVIDPASFGRTIENIFHCSFLIKDGFAHLKLDQNGLPVIQHCDSRSTEVGGSASNQTAEHVQHVFSMDMKLWRELIEVFQIKDATINDAEVQAISKKMKKKHRNK